jgi:hypothetical protein
MPAPLRLVDVANSALKQGVSTGRFKISQEDAARIRAAEKRGHDAGLRVLLEVLFSSRKNGSGS